MNRSRTSTGMMRVLRVAGEIALRIAVATAADEAEGRAEVALAAAEGDADVAAAAPDAVGMGAAVVDAVDHGTRLKNEFNKGLRSFLGPVFWLVGWNPAFAHRMRKDGASRSARLAVGGQAGIPSGMRPWNPTFAHRTRKDGAPTTDHLC